MIATKRGAGMRWTPVVPISERHEGVRQRRVVLTSRCWRQATEAKEPFSGESTL